MFGPKKLVWRHQLCWRQHFCRTRQHFYPRKCPFCQKACRIWVVGERSNLRGIGEKFSDWLIEQWGLSWNFTPLLIRVCWNRKSWSLNLKRGANWSKNGAILISPRTHMGDFNEKKDKERYDNISTIHVLHDKSLLYFTRLVHRHTECPYFMGYLSFSGGVHS